MSPASRGTLITAGYVAVRLWRTIGCGDHKGWVSVSWKAACFFPGIAFLILTTLNFLLWGSHSTGAIPFSLFVILLLLWFCISVPLTLVGGYFGAKAPHIEYPVRTNQIPREIPAQKYPSWLLVLGAGTLPFGTLFIELFFIMSSIWMGRVYYVFGFLFIVLILLVVVCAEVSLVLTYMHLCVEDWKWWWKSFFASGSVAIYIFLYSVNYLVFDLKSLSGPVSATLYLGYSLFMVLAIMFATGTIGFLSSFWFVHYLFSSMSMMHDNAVRVCTGDRFSTRTLMGFSVSPIEQLAEIRSQNHDIELNGAVPVRIFVEVHLLPQRLLMKIS
ncbi:hypothetical protein CRYUN_Cryun33cG0032800 [Craigia yunnanensis]